MQRRHSGVRPGAHGATCATPGTGNEHSRADRRSVGYISTPVSRDETAVVRLSENWQGCGSAKSTLETAM